MIEYKESNTNLISSYLDLYRKCFHNYNKNIAYLNWLYKENPMGNYIGIDAHHNNKIIGQIGGIPINFKFYNNHIKTLVLINTCIEYRYRGGRVFYNLAKKLEKTLIEKDYELLIGVGNKIATPAWIRSIQLKKLCPLQSYVGFYDFSRIQNTINKYRIYTDWNSELIQWRCLNPINKTRIFNYENYSLVSSETQIPFVKVYAPLTFNHTRNIFFKKKLIDPNLKIFIGLSNEINKSFFFRQIPEFFKSSPLNFLYKFLKKDFQIKKNKIFFSFLDFDAF